MAAGDSVPVLLPARVPVISRRRDIMHLRRRLFEQKGLTEVVRSALARRERKALDNPELVCAAVLIPLIFHEGEWHVVVTRRTDLVRHHRGQISFPGGACDPGDADLRATALRETHEELGVAPELVDVLGNLDDFRTITDFAITPFVGTFPQSPAYRLNKDEVAAVIQVPLSFLLDPDHLRVEPREHDGRLLNVLFWDYGPHTIWGVTAHILKEFVDMVAEACEVPPPSR